MKNWLQDTAVILVHIIESLQSVRQRAGSKVEQLQPISPLCTHEPVLPSVQTPYRLKKAWQKPEYTATEVWRQKQCTLPLILVLRQGTSASAAGMLRTIFSVHVLRYESQDGRGHLQNVASTQETPLVLIVAAKVLHPTQLCARSAEFRHLDPLHTLHYT